MIIACIIFTLICCFCTYKITVYQVIKLDKINGKCLNIHQELIGKSLNEIDIIKKDIIRLKEGTH